MACTSPLKAYKAPGGGIVFSSKHGYYDRMIQLQCGACLSCRIARSRDWAVRAMHEAQMAGVKNCFITLTYDEANLPEDRGLDVEEWKRFAKRMRKNLGPFRYLHCGEYGDENLRPHYHACIFGQDFSEDREKWKVRKGHQTWTSPTLEKLWPYGFSEIGSLTYDSAAYVARYVVKKATGKKGEEAVERVDAETGEVWTVNPEYATMSRNKGLGETWFQKYWRDVYPDDFVIANGKKARPPKYYDKQLEKLDKEMYLEIKKKGLTTQLATLGTQRRNGWR